MLSTHSFLRLSLLSLSLFCAGASAQAEKHQQFIIFRLSQMGAPMKMMFVKGGSFLMGSQNDDPSMPNYNPEASQFYNDETPVHRVEVKDFYIAQLEVTRELWADLMGGDVEIGSAQLAQGSVSYDMAQQFISSANATFADVMPQGSTFALPTEEQWEYAAQGGAYNDPFAYAGSNTLNDVAVWGGATEVPGEVATKMPNSLGLYDMSGNAVEWTQSYYSSNYESEPDLRFRVMRGGGIQVRPGREKDLRVTARSRDLASRAMKYYGFRLVLNIPDESSPSNPTSAQQPMQDPSGRPYLKSINGRLAIFRPDGTAFDICGWRL